MCTPNVQENNDDNGNGKKLSGLSFQLRFAQRWGKQDLLSLHRSRLHREHCTANHWLYNVEFNTFMLNDNVLDTYATMILSDNWYFYYAVLKKY